MTHRNALIAEIDRSLNRLEASGIADYRPLFLSGDDTPMHDTVRTWVRGFWKAMALAPETWSALVEDERTRVLIEPFVGFFDLNGREPYATPANIDELLNEDAARIPRLILVLRKLARIRTAKAYAPQRDRQIKRFCSPFPLSYDWSPPNPYVLRYLEGCMRWRRLDQMMGL